ncbi:hypothetical protein Tco_0806967 [Tanacetum coccineum]
MEYEKAPLRLHWICSPEYPQKGTFALPSQTVVAATIEVGTDVGSPNVRTSRDAKSKRTAWTPIWCRLVFAPSSSISCRSLYTAAVSLVSVLAISEIENDAYASQ